MSDEMKQDRSPRSPKFGLQEALTYIRKLYSNAGKSIVTRDMAAKAMGYNGLNGAALTALATITQYGLVEKHGSKIGISHLALKVLHPGPDGPEPAIREAALTPPIFRSIFENHHQLSEELLANHLIHQGFTHDAAKKGASVYKHNSEFAKLDIQNTFSSEPANSVKPDPEYSPSQVETVQPEKPISVRLDTQNVVTSPTSVVKEYSFPLDDENEVEIKFLGKELGIDQLRALQDTVEFLIRQFERRKTAPRTEEA